jgi:hypothetical protein
MMTEFTEKDKELITIALSIISTKTNQKVNFQFEKNTVLLFYGENECERFDLIDNYNNFSKEQNKV